MKNPGIETATVLKTEGKWAMVRTNKSTSCNECGKAQAGICGKGGEGMVMRVFNVPGAQQGDDVELGLEKKTQMKGYLLAFILPVIALFPGVYAGDYISRNTGIQGLDAVAGVSGLILTILCCLKKIQSLDKSSPLCITKIIHCSVEK